MTIPGLGGQVPPRPDQQYQGGGGGVIGPGSPNVVRARLVIVSGSGPGTGLFLYNGTPAAGNLPVFYAVAPGTTTDPFGNGITAIVGIGQQSGGHWHWDASGNLDVNNTSSALIARWRPTDQALLFYAPGGGLGSLLLSLAAAAGTDQDGTVFVQGLAAYKSGNIFQVGLNTALNTTGFSITNAASPPYVPPIFTVQQATAAGCSATIFSGRGTVAAGSATINLDDSLFSATTNGLIELLTGRVNLGVSGAMSWNDNNQTLSLPAGSGPFVTGQGWNAVSLGTNLTGTIRVKKVPWLGVWLDLQVTYNATAAATITCGSLPDATYYPTGARQFDLSTTGTPGTGVFPRVFVPGSGAAQIIVPSYSATGSQLSCSVVYPTNLRRRHAHAVGAGRPGAASADADGR